MIESILEPLFHKTSIKKHWTFAEVGTNFEIHENNISFESLNYYLSICDSDKLVFGRCSSARLAVELMNVNIELTGRNFDVNFTFENEPEVPFVVGNFTVTEDKPSPDRKTRSVTMYDALYFVLNTNYADWYNSISDNDWESMTLGGLVDSFFAYVGITVESASRAVLVNADMPVSKTLATEQLLGSDILFAICQAAGCFGVMTNNNEFRFLYLKSEIEGLFPANDLYPAEDLYPVEPVTTYIPNSEYYPPLVYETFMTPSITKLRIAESTNDVGTVVGSGDAGYEIIGNFLFFGKSAADLNTYGANTLGAMTQRNYRPFSVEKVGNLCFEIGDPIRLGNENMAVESYILTRTFKGVQAFTDEISAAGTQDYTVVASSISTTVDKLQSKTLVLKKDIDGVSTELTEQLALDGIVRQGTYAEQTNTKFSQKVSVEYGNHTTDSFSWDMDITGHAWYKGNQQVMKIDGNGLSVKGSITAGSTIKGASLECVDSNNLRTSYISADGSWAEFANGAVKFDSVPPNSKAEFNFQDVKINLADSGAFTVSCQNSGAVLTVEEEYSSSSLLYSQGVYIGCDSSGTVEANKVAINGSTWVHVGVNSPDVRIGGTDGTTTDVRIQADTNAHIKFRYTINAGTTQETVATTTLADLMSGISSALSSASSAISIAGSAASDVSLLFTAFNSLSDDVRALEAEARNHGWNV